MSATLLLVFDVIYIQNAHSGRMDLVALAFFLAAISVHLSSAKKAIAPFLIACLGTLAVLTTLRIAAFVLPFFIALFFFNLINRNWRYAIVLLITSLILYGIWIWWGFGSIINFIQEYAGGKSSVALNNKNLISSFVGGNYKVPFYQIPLVIIGSISVLTILLKTYRRIFVWILIMPIPFFYLLVKDTGAYSAMVIPFWYLSIAYAALLLLRQYSCIKAIRYPIYAVIIMLLFINTGIFALKAITIIGTKAERDPKPLAKWVNIHLPEGSRVVGDDRYYYACLQNNSDFQYMDRVHNHSTRAQYHASEYQPDYLFISTQTPKVILEAYKDEFYFEEQWVYKPANKNIIIQRLINKLSISIQSSYEGTLIKVTGKKIKSK